MSSQVQNAAPLSPATLQKIRDIQAGVICWSEDGSSVWDTSDEETVSEFTVSPEIKREPARWTSSATASRPIVVLVLSSDSEDEIASVAPSIDSAAEVFVNYLRYPELRRASLDRIGAHEQLMEGRLDDTNSTGEPDPDSVVDVDETEELTSPLISRYQHQSDQNPPVVIPHIGDPYLDPSLAEPVVTENAAPSSFEQIGKLGCKLR